MITTIVLGSCQSIGIAKIYFLLETCLNRPEDRILLDFRAIEYVIATFSVSGSAKLLELKLSSRAW